MTWRVAKSLLTLRDQIDKTYPDRDKASDGTIGDEDHQNRASDHNPWYGPGIVTAIDITHDPSAGVDIDRLTDELQASRDPRIKYVIANGLIMDTRPGYHPWQWVPYHGTNPHTRHMHVSCVAAPACDDTRPWNLPSLRKKRIPNMAFGGALRALRKYFNTAWHNIDTADFQVSLRGSILRTRELAWQSWHDLGAKIRANGDKLDRIERKLDELNGGGE